MQIAATHALPIAEGHNSCGNLLRDHKLLDDTVAGYRRVLETGRDFAEEYNYLGNAFYDIGQFDDALTSYRHALESKPDFADAYYNLGNVQYDIRQLDDAVASYRKAVESKPDFADAHNNLANALYDIGQLDDAVASYRKALEINPNLVDAHCNLGMALRYLGRLDEALICVRAALEVNPASADAQSILLFIQNYFSSQSSELLLDEARQFGELAAQQAIPYESWDNVPDPGKCLRVGFVSGDFHNHPVGYFVEGLLAALSSQASGRLELIAYPTHFHSDALTKRVKASFHGWHSAVGLSDESLARWVRYDGIDILIDLSGHTAHNRLPMFAWKPAPVQASWLGYFATTGVAAIDYLIADPWTLPQFGEACFTEKIWRLPDTRLCFTPPDIEMEVSPLPALANGFVTFGCFNNLAKMNDEVVILWSRVLTAVPDSRLFLKAIQLGEASVRRNTLKRFAVHGIDTSRLILEGPEPRKEYLAAYQRIDIALDPFPFPGGTTSVEGLWMGVPVLTMAAERFLSRQGIGILMNAGLPEWIAADTDDYVARAVLHASDLQRLADLRNDLRQQMLASPVFDMPRFAKNFEAALRGMWQRWCEQQQNIVSDI